MTDAIGSFCLMAALLLLSEMFGTACRRCRKPNPPRWARAIEAVRQCTVE